MNKKLIITGIVACVLLVLTSVTLFAISNRHNNLKIVIEGELLPESIIEYTGTDIQFPMAHVENDRGEIVSYDVNYTIISKNDNSSIENKYATFELKVGDYTFVYNYADNEKVKIAIPFSIKDTTSPTIEMLNVPNGLFLQDMVEGEAQKLPLYTINDASMTDGMDLKKTLYFKGENDNEFVEYPYKDINNSYMVDAFGRFKYIIIATDAYGNSSTQTAEWIIKDRNWKPAEKPATGYLADYSSEGYTNYVESGDTNQWYIIGNDYEDTWLSEYEGASGVLKVDMGFNDAVGYGNNSIKLHFAKSFTKQDIKGKYLAVRILVEGDNLKDSYLFGGNNVEFRNEDQTTRAFTTPIDGLETGKWVTHYIPFDTVENIGIYPNAKYNAETTFYEGGDPATSLQLCFSRVAGHHNRMTLYVDSISIAEKLPQTNVTVDNKTASWNKIDKAVGYRVDINGHESVIKENQISITNAKGYIKVTPMGDGVLNLDGEETTAVFGIDAGDKLAAFDNELYVELFSDRLYFSTDAEHAGYKPSSFIGSYTDEGVTLKLGTGAWEVCTGTRLLFPKAQSKGDNTTLVLNMSVSNPNYRVMRIYDYDGIFLKEIKLTPENTGEYHKFEIDLSGYDQKMKGLNIIFGPSENFVSVPEGVTLKYKDIEFSSTYYDIEVNGEKMKCAGTRTLETHYTTDSLVQFKNLYNFAVKTDNTPLSFDGMILVDGKKVGNSEYSIIGYLNTDTISLNIAHEGKILTILKDSVIYYENKAILVAETFNAKWVDNAWVKVDKIPEPPKDEYIDVDGSKKLVVNKTTLNAGYTTGSLVQFTNVNNIGVPSDNTTLSFKGTMLLNGTEVPASSVSILGYKDNMTISLNIAHEGKILTILKDSVIYYENKAILVAETFNAKWVDNAWVKVDKIPEPPKDEYIDVDGSKKLVVNKTTLNAGYTTGSLVQFTNVNNIGVPSDNTTLSFKGTMLLNGAEVPASSVSILGYKDNMTISLNIAHEGKILTILKDSVIYYENKAILVAETFNAKWVDNAWVKVDKIPEPPKDEYIDVDGSKKLVVNKTTLNAGYTTGSLVQFTNVNNIGVPSDNTTLSFKGTMLLNGAEVPASSVSILGYKDNMTISLNIAHEGKILTILKDSVIYYENKAILVAETFNAKWVDNAWVKVDKIPEPDIPDEQTKLSFMYSYGTSNLIQVKTNLPSTTPCVSFTAIDNGCDIDENANLYQQFGWAGMVLGDDGNVYISFNFNNDFEAGQTYVLPEGAVFGFTDGKTYTLDKDYIFTFDGSGWTMAEGTNPVSEKLSFMYSYGTSNLIQVKTNLPSTTPCVSFTAIDNGCDIDENANLYQQFGWAGMVLGDDGNVYISFNFNNDFEAGQTYVLPEGAVFGFTDGKTYTLDKDYIFTFDGSGWTMAEGTNPVSEKLSFMYSYGTSNLIQVKTNLPSTTPCVSFTAIDNGCDIDENANLYQQFGWAGMVLGDDGNVYISFNFNNDFEAGQTYVLPEGAVFGFTDGKTYTLDKDYIFTFDGSGWTMAEGTNPVSEKLSFMYSYGTSNLIQVKTNLPSTTPCVSFTAIDNGCDIDENANLYQQFGWAGMVLGDDGNVYIAFNFNNDFEAGQTYVLPEGAVFGFTDGKTYTLDKDYIFTFDGSGWTMAEGTNPVSEKLSFMYSYGTSNLIQVKTNLPSTTPCVSFTAIDNGCDIDESANLYQQFGWAGMVLGDDGNVYIAFNFNNDFEAGQTYVLPEGAVFGFTDGKTYTLDKDYIFTFDGSGWTMAEGTNPVSEKLSFMYSYGTSNLIQVKTNLPSTTPCVSFTAVDNGCDIDENANLYQQFGWAGMVLGDDGNVYISFNFNNDFEAGQTYVLPEGAVFGFTDGKTYTLDKDYIFTFDGSGWTL